MTTFCTRGFPNSAAISAVGISQMSTSLRFGRPVMIDEFKKKAPPGAIRVWKVSREGLFMMTR